MLAHLRPLAFFDAAAVGDALVYFSGAPALEAGGLAGLLALLHDALRARRPTLLVIDGLVTVAETAEAEGALRRFLLDLQALVEAVGGTAVLLVRPLPGRADLAHTMVDGVLVLADEPVEVEVLRLAEVRKFRGGGYLRGRHGYAITDDGLVLYPRTEARYAAPAGSPPPSIASSRATPTPRSGAGAPTAGATGAA